VSQKNVPPLNCLWLCQILIDFQKFCTAGKRMKFAIKAIWQYPPYLRHVATLPWEIKHSNFQQIFSRYGRKRKQIAFLIASNWLRIIFLSLFFYLLTFTINLCHRKYVTADVTAVFFNNQYGIQRRGQEFDFKKFVFEGVHGKEVHRRTSWE